ncbi:embryonic protein DC-8-like isoform X2 [Sesamum indicum]|uniref:Embryonic protein DC-8-like isoform X2 n=1 Tax=Sesamum indicum TaxID=4182 RepID=A0A6I9UIQ2_SESIN|nr:embryonic protein DC-8-like isoform X2 [Sesamum indicum]
MASKQLRRENHVTDERETVVKKDRVPKMTTHFESLAEKARDEQHNAPVHGEKPHQFETPPVGIQVSGSDRMRREEGLEEETEREKRASQIHAEKEEKEQQAAVYGERKEGTGEKENHGGEESQVPSLEEISNLRAKAQQNSTEAIRAAEERYEKSKEKGASALHKAKDYTAKKAVAAKEVAVESGKGVAEYTGKVAAEVKDHAIVAGWGATHYTLEKAAEATKAVAGITSSVAGYTGEKVVVAKDKVAGAGKSLAGYAGEKIAAAKDAVVATEESAAEYAARKKAAAEKELEAKRASHDKTGEKQSLARSSNMQGTSNGKHQQMNSRSGIGKEQKNTANQHKNGAAASSMPSAKL